MTIAVVLGFNIHGLAVARSLSRAGIEVHAITASMDMPTVATRYATVHLSPHVNTDGIVAELKKFSREVLKGKKAVLFPTSDNMVTAIARHWPELESAYLLSWSHCREKILTLIEKKSLPDICQQQGVSHPESISVASPEDCKRACLSLPSPLIVKPSRPLSNFKTLMVSDLESFMKIVAKYPSDLPYVAQTHIDGGDDSLYFCTMYLIDGERVCTFTGRKLRAEPEGLGQGTVFAGEKNSELIEISDQFLKGLDLSGPVAIEYKRDASGKYWLIEPNIGRTEYCVDLAIQSGANLPLIEYNHATGKRVERSSPLSKRDRTWYDTDKDPRCYFRFIRMTRQIRPFGKLPVFPYFGHGDWRPVLRASSRLIRRLVRRLF